MQGGGVNEHLCEVTCPAQGHTAQGRSAVTLVCFLGTLRGQAGLVEWGYAPHQGTRGRGRQVG